MIWRVASMPVTRGHLDIEHRDVGMVLADEPERLPAVSGLSHDGDLGVFFQELTDAFADDGVVVGKDGHGWDETWMAPERLMADGK